MQADGVRLAGRLTGVDGTRVTLRRRPRAVIDAADRRLARLLGRIDAAIDTLGLAAEVLDAEPLPPVAADRASPTARPRRRRDHHGRLGHRPPPPLPLARPSRPRPHGEIRQRRGVTPVPGVYVLGQRFQHYRNSNFIDGVGRDAALRRRAHLSHRRQLTAVSTGPLPEQK